MSGWSASTITILAARRVGAVIGVVMALRRPVDAIGPEEPGVEPLRAVGRAHLARQHDAQLVVEGAGVVLAVEIATFPAPIGPGAGEPVEALLGAGLVPAPRLFRQLRQHRRIGNAAPQPRGDSVFFDGCEARRHAG